MEEDVKTNHQVPIDVVDADQLPRDSGISYKEMCSVIGDIYFRMQHQEKNQAEQFQAVVNQLRTRIQELVTENSKLKAELSRNEGGAEA